MARKKTEVVLQVEVETQEEWEEMLAKEGLTVVDVYQDWSGPCKAMVSNFRRFKNELGDDLLRFAVAKADTVDALEKYRGRCEPCFLFFAGGVLVSVIRGANCPLLQKYVFDQLATEHRVLDGATERKEIRDPLLSSLGEKEDSGEDDEDDESSDGRLTKVSFHDRYDGKKGISVAIIKPDLVQAGRVEEIIEKMKEHGIEILEREERQLTPEDVREFYEHLSEEEYFEKVVEFMSSGPSVILVITKGDTGDTIIEEWRELLGPKNVTDARETAPDSLRAQYGTEEFVNALHGSDSNDTAMRELAFFFPGFSPPTLATQKTKATAKSPDTKIQRTLALIRPDALREKKDEIMAKIAEAGFTVAMAKEMQLTKEQAEDFYSEHRGQDYFEELTNSMCNGPLLALALAREDAIDGWREKLGPKEVEKAKEEEPESFRAQFSVEGVPVNPLHGSDSDAAAQKELEYFFGPVEQTIAVIKPEAFQTQDEIMNRIREAGFHIAARKKTELTKDIASEFYKEHADKDYFGDLTDHMTSGPTLFMVLSRENAVEGWRSLIGPTDPAEAAPDTIRAQFGQDIKANAVHGSSNLEHAKEHIQLVFGDMEFASDGGQAEEQAEAAATEGETGADVTDGAQTEAAPEAATEEAAPAAEEEAAAAEEQAPATEAATAEEGETQQTEEPAGEEEPSVEQPAAEAEAPAE